MKPLSNIAVSVNNDPIAIVPNSVSYTEGFGEQTMRAASVGGASVEQVFSQDLESTFSMVKFEIYPDIDVVKLLRGWKTNGNANTVTLTGSVDGKTFRRTFKKAAILNDYEVALGSDTTVEIEFKSDAAV
tara:strand:+ start:4493 stop:4882 length:390 start_codon:yes stop_codon:yes gene_type:complete